MHTIMRITMTILFSVAVIFGALMGEWLTVAWVVIAWLWMMVATN